MPGLPNTADMPVHFIRSVEMFNAWQEGIWLPRWSANLGYGYGIPLFNYAPVLPYLSTAFLHTLGLPMDTALKGTLLLAVLLAAFGSYWMARDPLGSLAGAVSAAAYLYAPIRLRELFIQGNVGQFLAWVFLPWACWGLIQFFRTGRPRYGIVVTFALAATLLSHNVVALLLGVFLALLGLMLTLTTQIEHGFAEKKEGPQPRGDHQERIEHGFAEKKEGAPPRGDHQERIEHGFAEKDDEERIEHGFAEKKKGGQPGSSPIIIIENDANRKSLIKNLQSLQRPLWALLFGVWGLALSAWFWMPALLEGDYIQLSRIVASDFRARFVPFWELISLSPPLDRSAINPYFPLTLGAVQVSLAAMGLLCLIWFWIATLIRSNATCSNDFRREMANPQISMLEVNSTQNSVNPAESRVNSAQNSVNPAQNSVNPAENSVNPAENRANSEDIRVNPAENRANSEDIRVNPEDIRVNPEERGRPLLPDTKRKIFERSPRASARSSRPRKTTEGGAWRTIKYFSLDNSQGRPTAFRGFSSVLR